jgi:hypothetical protein
MDENLNSQDPMDQGVPAQPEMPPMPEAPQPAAPAPEVPVAPEPSAPVAPEPVSQPQAPAQDYVQPAAQQYYAAPQPAYGSDTGDSFNGYFDGLMSLLSTPQRLINGLSQNITKAFIFIGISLGIWGGTSLVTSVLRVFKMNSSAQKTAEEFADKYGTEMDSVVKIELDGKFWGEQFKAISLTALYAVGFILLIAGVVYILSLIGKKTADFNKSFGLTSVLSINFVAQAAVSVISLVSLYWTDASDFIGLITTSIIGIAFIYSSVLLIQGLVDGVGLSYFVVICSYVVSVVFGMFVLGKMIKDYGVYFNVDFGGFGSGQTQLLRTLDSSLSEAIEYLDDLDFDY